MDAVVGTFHHAIVPRIASVKITAAAINARDHAFDVRKASAGFPLSRFAILLPAMPKKAATPKHTTHATVLSPSAAGTTVIAESSKVATIISPHKYQIVLIIVMSSMPTLARTLRRPRPRGRR